MKKFILAVAVVLAASLSTSCIRYGSPADAPSYVITKSKKVIAVDELVFEGQRFVIFNADKKNPVFVPVAADPLTVNDSTEAMLRNQFVENLMKALE